MGSVTVEVAVEVVAVYLAALLLSLDVMRISWMCCGVKFPVVRGGANDGEPLDVEVVVVAVVVVAVMVADVVFVEFIVGVSGECA